MDPIQTRPFSGPANRPANRIDTGHTPDPISARTHFQFDPPLPLAAKQITPFCHVLAEDRQKRPLGGVKKRVFDIVFSGLGLIVLTPFLMVSWCLIRLESSGPGIFRQKRGGFRRRSFVIYKFRSMKPHRGPLRQAVMGDSRLTRLGSFIRRTSIDELPQLINVLCGHMSLIGPRPHALVHDKQFAALDPRYNLRFTARPGITGWAQVNGARGLSDTPEKRLHRIELDLEYVRNWSLWLDIKILFLTVLVLIKS